MQLRHGRLPRLTTDPAPLRIAFLSIDGTPPGLEVLDLDQRPDPSRVASQRPEDADLAGSEKDEVPTGP